MPASACTKKNNNYEHDLVQRICKQSAEFSWLFRIVIVDLFNGNHDLEQ